jgi:hypothetical protein
MTIKEIHGTKRSRKIPKKTDNTKRLIPYAGIIRIRFLGYYLSLSSLQGKAPLFDGANLLLGMEYWLWSE